MASALATLGWSRIELGKRLDCAEATIRKWEKERAIPEAVAEWLGELEAFIKAHQPPDWRTRAKPGTRQA